MREKKEYLMKCMYVEKERETKKEQDKERGGNATEIIKIPRTENRRISIISI